MKTNIMKLLSLCLLAVSALFFAGCGSEAKQALANVVAMESAKGADFNAVARAYQKVASDYPEVAPAAMEGYNRCLLSIQKEDQQRQAVIDQLRARNSSTY